MAPPPIWEDRRRDRAHRLQQPRRPPRHRAGSPAASAAIAESATLAVDAKAKALKAAGRPVIGFGAGEPDFPTPDYIVEAAIAAAAGPAPTTATPRPAGCPSCKRPSPPRPLRDSGYEVAPAQVLVTNGGKQAVYKAFAALLDPGDEVLLPAPYWTTYPEAIRLAGGVPVEVFAGEDQGYLVTVEQLEAARTAADQGAAVLLAVQPDRRGLLARAGRARSAAGPCEHGIWVVTDEIYEHLIYDGAAFASMPVEVPELADTLRRGQRRRQDLRDDRLAGGLDDRPARRHQGRDQPAVARHVQRRQRLPAGGDRRADRRPGRGRARCRSPSTGGVAPSSAMLNDDRRRRLPDAAGRVLRLPLGQGRCSAGRSAASTPHDLGRAGRADPRRGRGGGRARRGVRTQRLPAAVLRPRRRRPRRGRRPAAEAARRGRADRDRVLTLARCRGAQPGVAASSA